ncbi:GNAT family N-acetyltransferase [Streptomyces sp. SCSIO 30461]|uniref:GNAT family N-acetyltransferase n=1 Tax=Streptomyces sp. SCSIO 30461 TaxID=3118085 RepID=UPI0030D22DD6
MDVIIRLVEPQEYSGLGELTAQTYLDDGLLAFGKDDPYLPVLRDTAGRAAQSDVLVAVDGSGRILGGVAFTLGARPYADVAREDEAEFRMLVVATEARKRGIGEALVMACLERARAVDGCHRLVLSTDQQMHAAHRIYERMGFVRTPDRDWSPFAELDPLLTYALEL